MFIRIRGLMFSIFIVIISVMLVGCSNSTEPASTVTMQMEIISRSQILEKSDSNFYYHQSYPEWNSTAFFDTLHADSLAKNFTKSKYNITDMWFPNEISFCSRPYNTYNLVYIKLASSDSTIKELGFSIITQDFSECFQYWRHYKYIRN